MKTKDELEFLENLKKIKDGLVLEQKELDLKLEKLGKFIFTDKAFRRVSLTQKNLLEDQHDGMSKYHFCLKYRILDIEKQIQE